MKSSLHYIGLLFVEHSDRFVLYCHGEGQFGLFNEEHPTAIQKQIHEELYLKYRTFPTMDALESLSFSQPH